TRARGPARRVAPPAAAARPPLRARPRGPRPPVWRDPPPAALDLAQRAPPPLPAGPAGALPRRAQLASRRAPRLRADPPPPRAEPARAKTSDACARRLPHGQPADR